MDNPLYNLTDADLGNSQVREHAGRVSRELDRLVATFDKALRIKGKKRVMLQKIALKRHDQLQSNFTSLQTLQKNIDIYDVNLRKINVALAHLQQKEILLKNKYQALLHGASRQDLMEEVEGDISEQLTRDKLIQRRRLFLEELDKTFLTLEEELLTLETYKKELVDTKARLVQKRDKAIHLRVVLEEKRKLYLNEVKNLDESLRVTVEEEKVLIAALQKTLRDVQPHLDIPEEVDQLLFAFLTSVETSKQLAQKEPRDLAKQDHTQQET